MIHSVIKKSLGYEEHVTDEEIEKDWKSRIKSICKPCWELNYCPYGPLVEDFPLLPPIRAEVEARNEFLREQIKKGVYDEKRKEFFELELAHYNPEQYPEELPEYLQFVSCLNFGHICPVFFVCEGFTETSEVRRTTRNIPRQILIRVVRRDNQTCQECGRNLRDDEFEIDHIIPYSLGGPTAEHNLRVICPDCNKTKRNTVKL
jgi:hypothetical protein